MQDVIAEEKQNFSLPYVGDNAFDGCVNLSSFFIPHDISSFGDDVFNGCSSLSKVEIDLDVAAFLSVIDPSSSKTACDMLSSKFNCIRDDAKCALVFNDAVYMNDGNIKIDDEYVTIAYDGSMSAVQAFNYEMFISSGMTYLNLSNVSEVG